ncbi:UbiA family prenyltransferase [Sinobaca sp. H24]|uniref:UbiA family prenyltransferase n=1 Tax=Sinobaca sp. H24 TaxID=2923376 RepID=UPI00207998CC|nr:UbiA family prenyltransferase [Sinobaca sp. H24]
MNRTESSADSLHHPAASGKNQVTARPFFLFRRTALLFSVFLITFTVMLAAEPFSSFQWQQNLHLFILTFAGTGLLLQGCFMVETLLGKKRGGVTEKKDKQTLGTGLLVTAVGIMLLFSISMTTGLLGTASAFGYIIGFAYWLKYRSSFGSFMQAGVFAVLPLIAWSAADDSLHAAAWILAFLFFIWYCTYSLALSVLKKEEYIKAGIPVLAVITGNKTAKLQSILYASVFILGALMLGQYGNVYLISVMVGGAVWLTWLAAGLKMRSDKKWAAGALACSIGCFSIVLITMAIPAL